MMLEDKIARETEKRVQEEGPQSTAGGNQSVDGRAGAGKKAGFLVAAVFAQVQSNHTGD
jgi:hypothetical protein